MEPLADVLEVEHGVYVQDGLRLLGLNVLVDVLVEPAAEFGYVVPAQGKSGSVGVAAEVDEQVAATLDSRIDVEARHRACRACGKLAVARQHHGRPEIDFCQSGSNDADDALLPTFVVEHDARAVLLALQPGHDLVGLFGHLFVDVLALLVVFVDVLRHVESCREVFFNQQVNRFLAVLHASRSVDAWANLEDDVAHGEFAAAESADVDDGFQSGAGTLVQLLQPVEGQNAVFVGHRHNVGGDAHCTEVEQRNQP